MAKTEVQLLQRRLQNQILKVIGDNTVVLEYSLFEGQKPDLIDIKVFRGTQINRQNMPMQAMGGQFPLNGSYSIYNTNGNERKQGDGALTDEIYNLCMDVFNNNLNIKE